MNIINYDLKRANKSFDYNNRCVNHYNKWEWRGYVIKSVLLIIMSICLLAMCGCIIAAFLADQNIVYNPIIYFMIAFTTIAITTMLFVLRNRRLEYCDEAYYDNSETKYYRFVKKYKKVVLNINDKNEIGMVCIDQNDDVTIHRLIPKKIRSTANVKVPTLDMKYDCLWIPAV